MSKQYRVRGACGREWSIPAHTARASLHQRVYHAIDAAGGRTRSEVAVELGVPPQSICTAMRWLIRGDWIDSEGDRSPLRWSVSRKAGQPEFPDSRGPRKTPRDAATPGAYTMKKPRKNWERPIMASCVFDWAQKMSARR